MHEGPFRSTEDDDRPVFVSSIRRDGELRKDWIDVSETIAHIESGIALRRKEKLREEPLPADDSLQPGFVMVGRRRGLEAIGETATGIIKHGQAFRAWADLVGGDPEALQQFDQMFLGGWDSAAEFTGQLIRESKGLADTSEEERQSQAQLLASELADELQKRGVIRSIPNPSGGVWVFETPREECGRDEADAGEGGRHA